MTACSYRDSARSGSAECDCAWEAGKNAARRILKVLKGLRHSMLDDWTWALKYHYPIAVPPRRARYSLIGHELLVHEESESWLHIGFLIYLFGHASPIRFHYDRPDYKYKSRRAPKNLVASFLLYFHQ